MPPAPTSSCQSPITCPINPTMSNIAAAGTFTPIPNYFSGGIGDIGASTTDLQGIVMATNLASVTLNFTPVPEPAASVLAAIGGLAIAAIGKPMQ
jgi:hypothetical protein